MEIYLWAVLLIATALSGCFSLASNALRLCRRSGLEEYFGEKGRRERVAQLDRHLKALRMTASLCRSVTNLALVVTLLALLGPLEFVAGRVVLAVLLAGGIIAIFGVAIPHAWAAYDCERVVAATYPVLLVCRYALWPIVAVMNFFDMPIRRLAGHSDEDSLRNGEQAKQEILHAATEGQAEGTVDAEEAEMIESVMEFGDTQVGEIMTPRTDVFALPVDTPVPEAVEKIIEGGYSRIPVYSGDLDNIIGILYAKDLLRVRQQDGQTALHRLYRKPFFVPETKRLDDLLREFKTRKVHMAVALDEYGGTAGLVTVEDLVEEIVGDISDEYDPSQPALMHRVDEQTLEVDGRLPIDDLNDALDMDIPEDEDYDTVAGMVFSHLGYIPAENETFDAYGAQFTVLAASERKIDTVRIQLQHQVAHDEE